MSDCRFGVSPVNYSDPDPDPKYSRIRNSYLPHNLHTCHTEHLLHGRDDLSDTENEQLLLQVQEFI